MGRKQRFWQKTLTTGFGYAMIIRYNACGQFYFGGNMDVGTDGDTCNASKVKY